jgi:3-oxoacyl-[acyl-carrier-protein] synthase-3
MMPMTPISLVGTASYLPETVRDNAFFGAQGNASPMFKGSRFRHHVARDETATDMVERAARKLGEKLGLNFERDVDIILTNVPCLDQPFTGCGASVARVLGAKPRWIFDMQNTGCVSFVFMLELARVLMSTGQAKSALLCNVQNTAGRVFSHPENRTRPQSAIPGDGCGVAYVVANEESPVRAIRTRSYGEYADDMRVSNDDGEYWWEPRAKPMYIDFSESRVGKIVARGNQLVPAIVREACKEAGVTSREIDVLVTNQPNATFLRNWREALELPEHKHVHTFDNHGNLFGAAIPISIERAAGEGLKNGGTLAIGGFSHAGDYAGAAIIDWRAR